MLIERDSVLESPEVEGNAGESRGQKCWQSSSFKIYLGHTLSSWSDRMFSFAIGLFMVILFPDSLLLTGIYGFTNCLSGIIFGPYIGAWIDKTQRITAARYALVIQNSSVITGAVLLALTLHFRSDVKQVWNGGLEYVLYAVIIFIAIIAELASVASKIALEKDWIVVLAGGDGKKLATLNSTMRSIYLTTSILAPVVVGQIITYGSQIGCAAFIAIWNLISGIIEYHLLFQIYKMMPQLGAKNLYMKRIPFIKIGSPESEYSNSPGATSSLKTEGNNNMMTPNMTKSIRQEEKKSSSLQANEDGSTTQGINNRIFLTPGVEFVDVSLVTPESLKKGNAAQGLLLNSNGDSNNGTLPSTCCGGRPLVSVGEVTTNSQMSLVSHPKESGAWNGWKSYFSHHVKFSGLALACLYMTVLGFDSITTGFVYSQGVNEGFVGILTGVGAVFGILGSVSFPLLRRKLGKNKTGILGFSLESLCLLLCVGSIFTIGSPFKPQAILDRFENVSGSSPSYTSHQNLSLKEIWEKKTHVIILLTGIILARYGLWIADLSVTQIFQEKVEESHRGIINGVQDSLNKFMDLLKFTLVILLPSPETFGLLIILSWLFVFIGNLFFIGFAKKEQLSNDIVSSFNGILHVTTISSKTEIKNENQLIHQSPTNEAI